MSPGGERERERRRMELSGPWRIGDLWGWREGGRDGGKEKGNEEERRREGISMVPLAGSGTHLSLEESAEETLGSDIHPPPSHSLHFTDAMHDEHCHSV